MTPTSKEPTRGVGEDDSCSARDHALTAGASDLATPGNGGAVERQLEAEVAALTRALTGLTCGGSEFFIRKGDRYVADIDACVDYVQRVKRAAHDRSIQALKRAHAAEEALRALREPSAPSEPTHKGGRIDAGKSPGSTS